MAKKLTMSSSKAPPASKPTAKRTAPVSSTTTRPAKRPHTEEEAGAPDNITEEQRFRDISTGIEAGGEGLTRASRSRRMASKIPDEVVGESEKKVEKAGEEKEKAKASGPAQKETPKPPTSSSTKRSKSKSKHGKTKADPDARFPSRAALKNSPPEKPDISDKYTVRRVLAQRDVGGKSFYLVDWFPSWVPAPSVRKKEVEEWTDNKADHTLQWGHDTVYKAKNPTSDDEGPLIQQVIESVLLMYSEYMDPATSTTGRSIAQLAEELFKDDDWTHHEDSASHSELIMAYNNMDRPSTPPAAEVMRQTFLEAFEYHRSGTTSPFEPVYRNVRIQYNGEIDPRATSHAIQPASGLPILTYITPLFAAALWDPQTMRPETWAPDETPSQPHAYLSSLKHAVNALVDHCPFLLSLPWPLAFVSLFYWGDELQRRITEHSPFDFQLSGDDDDGAESGGNQSWEATAQDTIAYTYLDECGWENRCVDEVWSSFVAAQVWVHDEVERGTDGGGDVVEGEKMDESESDDEDEVTADGKKERMRAEAGGRKGRTHRDGGGRKGRTHVEGGMRKVKKG